MQPRESVEAAVAVILREDGQVLLGQRPAGKPWAGWWEFPGGKIEAGEAPFHALQRELHEELDITATRAYPWLTRHFDYPERHVTLRFFMVRAWSGEPHGKEGQALSWQDPAQLTVEPMLPANTPILSALQLPPLYGISNAQEMGETVFLKALEQALAQGLKLVQVREKQMDAAALKRFVHEVTERCHPRGARVLVNADPQLALDCGADGVHLSAARLMALREKPAGLLAAASCHDAVELARAAELGLDCVVLSPVQATRSHPQARPLGWPRFAELLRDYPVPVYALGGMQLGDLEAAWQHGAHGIAMQRAVWGG